MTIIVTGGAGFIGSNFVFHMLNKYPDYRIVCLDCLTYAGNLSTLAPVMDNPNFRFVKESITDREAVYKLFEEEHPDMVVNFAAESHVDGRDHREHRDRHRAGAPLQADAGKALRPRRAEGQCRARRRGDDRGHGERRAR